MSRLTLDVGQKIAGASDIYTLTERLDGPMNWLAECSSTKRGFVVIKVAGDEPFHRESHAREVAALELLGPHKGVAALDYVGMYENHPFIALSYVPLPSLKQVRSTSIEKMLSPSYITRVALGLARTLADVHRKGIVHRDIKPDNILVGGDESFLIDFGAALVPERYAEDQKNPGAFRYASPEHVEPGAVDHRADIYSLGLTMYECLAGQIPFQDDDGSETFWKRLVFGVPDPCSVNPLIPKDLARIVSECTQRDPNERIQFTEELVERLANTYAGMHPVPIEIELLSGK